MTMSDLTILLLSNVVVAGAMIAQHIRHKRYRESIHALLADSGRVEGEPALFIDETLRVTAKMGLPEPKARDFAHALLAQPAFRKAVAHEALHDTYVETHGRKP